MLIGRLRRYLRKFTFDVVAAYRKRGRRHPWPLRARNSHDLMEKLERGGHLLPLPSESAALANLIETASIDFLEARLKRDGFTVTRGGPRCYPDLVVLTGRRGEMYAVDVKVARVRSDWQSTESRITLCTGNTYFKRPNKGFPLILHKFGDYREHIAVVHLYSFDPGTLSHVSRLETVVHPMWRIGSKRRSSTTRKYIGAVLEVKRLRAGQGDFPTARAFYRYWRSFKF
jgi:hypothetical protein